MNTEVRIERANRIMKVRGEPTSNDVPDWNNKPDSYNRDMIACLNWYNSHVDQTKMRAVCEQRAGRSLKNASNNDVMQLGALIRMSEQGAAFSPDHCKRIADLATLLVANEEAVTPVERQRNIRADQASIAIAQIDGALDDFITNGTPVSIETILSQFKFNREEKFRINAYLERVNGQYKDSVESKDADVKQAWSFIKLKHRKELVDITSVSHMTKKSAKPVKSNVVTSADQVIAVNEKHGVVQVINGSAMKMVGKTIVGFDQKNSFMVRVKGVTSSTKVADIKKMIDDGKRIAQPVTGRLGQLWVVV